MLETPNVKSVYYNKPCDFTLEIYAYCKLTKDEILQAAQLFKIQNKWSTFPHGKKYKWYATHEDTF